jgi:hypothetical protein
VTARRAAWGGALWLLVAAIPAHVSAHARSISDAQWVLTSRGADVRVRMALIDLSALEGVLPGALVAAQRGEATEALRRHLQHNVRMFDASGPCAPVAGSFHALAAAEGEVRHRWEIRCAGAPLRVRTDLLMDTVPAHLHFATLTWADGQAELQRVLDPAARTVEVPDDVAPQTAGDTVAEYLALGIEHILTGWDHLIFLLVLLLWSGRLRETLMTVTGFTLGHSVTLGAAVLGWVSTRGPAVEALIGLTIALVAVENVWLAGGRAGRALPVAAVSLLLVAAGLTVVAGHVPPAVTLGMALFAACHFGLLQRMARPERWRWSIAGLFGLIHGFGFAGALTDLMPSSDHLVTALLGFNLGVEVGQLAVVLLAWPLLAWWSRRPVRTQWLVHCGSAAAAGAGLFWYVTRAFG